MMLKLCKLSLSHLTHPSNLSEYTNKDGLWWTDSNQLVVPDAFNLRQFMLSEMHDSPYRGHVGIKETKIYCTLGQPLLLM